MAFTPTHDILNDVWSGADPATTGFIRVTGTVGVTGGATEAKQDAEIAILTTINSNQTNGTQVTQIVSPLTFNSGSISNVGDHLDIQCAGYANTVVRISGIWVGTIEFRASVDGIDYDTIIGVPINGDIAQDTQANGIWKFPTSGFNQFKVIATAWTSGTASIAISAIVFSSNDQVFCPDKDDFLVTAYQGGTWDVGSITGTITLPTGASTSSNQTSGSQKTQIVDGSGNVWGPRTNSGSVNWFPVINLEAATTGSAVAPRTLQVGGSDGTNLRTLSTDSSGVLNVNATPLGTQDVNVTKLAGTAISVNNGTTDAGTQRVTISSDSTGQVKLAAGVAEIGNVKNSGTFAVQAAQSGTWTTGRTWTLASGTDSVAAVQSGTWTVQPGNTANTTAWLVTGTGGTFPVTDSGGSLTVDNNGTFAVQATIAASATSIGKAEDSASADGDVGVPALAVRKATPANTSGSDGDYEFLQMSAGRLWASATIDAALPAGAASIGQVTANAGTNLNTSALALESGGNLAASAASLSVLDDWDESDRAKVNLIVGQAGVQGGAGAVSATTQRVVIATDQTVIPTSIAASGTAAGSSVQRNTALTNTAVAIKASAGNLYGYHFSNQSNPGQDLYVHLYNVAAASVTVGTTTPSRSYFLPAGGVLDTPLSVPAAFSTAMSYAVSTTSTGGTAPTNAIYAHVEFL